MNGPPTHGAYGDVRPATVPPSPIGVFRDRQVATRHSDVTKHSDGLGAVGDDRAVGDEPGGVAGRDELTAVVVDRDELVAVAGGQGCRATH